MKSLGKIYVVEERCCSSILKGEDGILGTVCSGDDFDCGYEDE
jgi:hypothetical protein